MKIDPCTQYKRVMLQDYPKHFSVAVSTYVKSASVYRVELPILCASVSLPFINKMDEKSVTVSVSSTPWDMTILMIIQTGRRWRFSVSFPPEIPRFNEGQNQTVCEAGHQLRPSCCQRMVLAVMRHCWSPWRVEKPTKQYCSFSSKPIQLLN